MEKKVLRGLAPQTYEHIFDRSALDALEEVTALKWILSKIHEIGMERVMRCELTGSHLRITADNDPELHALLIDTAACIDVPVVPELYVAMFGELQAFTSGASRPIIVISSEMVDDFSLDEMRFVLGHELGHIKSAHVLYSDVANEVGGIVDVLASNIPGGALVSKGLQTTMQNWKRMSEFTADRAGLLACQDANAALTVLMKLAGLPKSRYKTANTEDFVAQARAFEAMDQDALNWIARRLSSMDKTHPWTVMRAHELLTWIDVGAYRAVLDGDHTAVLPNAVSFCGECGLVIQSGDVFCSGCGARLPSLH